MRLERLCALSGLKMPTAAEASSIEICAVSCNSRACVPGCIYVCIRGTQADGHTFIKDALARGAVAVVTEQNHPMSDELVTHQRSAVFLSCEDTRDAAARLYDAWYGHPASSMRLIAITGTNGKTSVSCMLASILGQAGERCGLIGTLGCRIGDRVLPIRADDPLANMTTPDPEQLYHVLAVMAREGVTTVVMEVSSHALALRKLTPLRFALAAYTNFTQDHLDFHGSMEAYLQAKAQLLPMAECVLINRDDPALVTLLAKATGPAYTVSVGGEGDFVATDVHCIYAGGVSYTLRTAPVSGVVTCPVPGPFTVSNSLMAAACALRLGVPMPRVQQALATFGGVTGRMERVPLGEDADFTVLIDYAHTPDALERLLDATRRCLPEGGRLRVLFGCGGDRDRQKRPRMGSIAARLADIVYLTCDNCRTEQPENIFADILRGVPAGTDLRVIPDREQAIMAAVAEANTADVVLLCGKGHETYEIDRRGRRPFDERAVVRAAMAARTRARDCET